MTTEQLIDEAQPIACQVSAIPANERDRWMEVGQQFYAQIDQVRELGDGYALRAGRDVSLQLIAEYVSRDRLCCAFLQWEIIVTQARGPIWLYLRGPEGTKEFLKRAIEGSTLLPVHVAQAAGFSTSSREAVSLETVEQFAERLRG